MQIGDRVRVKEFEFEVESMERGFVTRSLSEFNVGGYILASNGDRLIIRIPSTHCEVISDSGN